MNGGMQQGGLQAQTEKRITELKKLTHELEIHGCGQENAIYDLAAEMADVEGSIQKELDHFRQGSTHHLVLAPTGSGAWIPDFRHMFDEARHRTVENNKRCKEIMEDTKDELVRFEQEEKRVMKIKLLNSELRSEKEKIEMKKKEMMKSLDGLKEELDDLKNKQNAIDLKRSEIAKALVENRQKSKKDSGRFSSKHKIESMGREGENLAEQSDGIIEKMDELEKEYETTYETFMGELKKNNDIVQGIREKIARIEMDN